MKLDLTKLKNLKQIGRNFQSQCPACDEIGRDQTRRNHLGINGEDGSFCCAVSPRDRDHSRRILALAGNGSRGRGASPKRVRPNASSAESAIISAARANLHSIVEKYADPSLSLLLQENPHPFGEIFANTDPRYFLSCLFHEDDILWTGDTRQSGPHCRHHWKSLKEILTIPAGRIPGPFTTPSTWPHGTTSRSKSLVLTSPYVLLDFDEIDGKKPESPEDIARLFHQSIALIRWIREYLDWELAAIVQTGNKSLHAWFHTPDDPDAVSSLKSVCKVLGIDDTVDNSSQPCRLTGQPHSKSGRLSRSLWLQSPEARR